MIANYHTHTERCMHAVGSEESYILRAIDAGFEELGFSDHSPYLFGNDFFSDYRMSPCEYQEYVQCIEALKLKYSDKIRIYTGLELEYYPKHFSKTIDFVLQYDLDYLLLGQHFTNNEYDGIYVHSYFERSEALLKDYVDQTIDAMQTGLFTYVAHPDIIRYDRESALYKKEMRRLCIAAKDYELPLEINLGGMGRSSNYPSDDFFKIAGDVQNDIIIGCDAHSVDAIASDWTDILIRKALEMVERNNLKLIEKATLIKPQK